jgi:cytochrome c
MPDPLGPDDGPVGPVMDAETKSTSNLRSYGMKKTIVALGLISGVAVSSQALAADLAAGEKIAKTRCAACHTFEAGGPNKVGPNLHGVVERGPKAVEGFNYSKGYEAAAATGFTWDDAHLDEYLSDPTAFLRDVSGDEKARSKMTFKLPKEDDRANVIAYLKTLK